MQIPPEPPPAGEADEPSSGSGRERARPITEQEASAPASLAHNWAAVSVAIIVPYLSEWAGPPPANHIVYQRGNAATSWRLRGLWTKGRRGGVYSTANGEDPHDWFVRARAIGALAPSACWHAPLGLYTHAHEGNRWRFEARGIEHFDFDQDAGFHAEYKSRSFLVIHGRIAGTDPSAPMHFVRWISKPDKGVHNPVSHFLRLSGIDAALHSNGHVWKRSGNIDVERSRRLTPFVVTHLATHDEVPNLRSGTLQAQRPTVEMWASLMTSRHPLQRGYVAPSHDANTPARHHSQFGSTHVQASRNALTFITTESFETRSKAHTTHSRISQLAHLHAVRMAMLAIRQRDFLDGHADALARLDWGQPVKTIRDHAIRLEKAQMQFQNKVWLARIPERPQFNMVMTLLSEASEIQALLRDISDESASISRVLELDNARESHRSWEALNRLVAYLALPAVLLSAASLWAATNMTFAARSLGIAVAAALSAWLLIGWHTRRGN